MKVAIGIDHNGMQIKNQIKEFLKNNNIEVIDPIEGNDPFDDYPDYAFAVGDKVASKEADLGILLCGTGIGMCIAANKIKGIRCAHVSNENEAKLSREHNNANILAISTKSNINDILNIIDAFIKANFTNEERHIRRIQKINNYESK